MSNIANNLELLKQAVQAQAAYYDAINEFESALTAGEGFSDRCHDRIVDLIAGLAADHSEINQPTEEHLQQIVSLAKEG